MKPRIAVVIPCYRVRSHVLDVIRGIGEEVSIILAIDDKCPEQSGDFVEQNVTDPRVRVIRNEINLGVGGAVMNGYRAALEAGADIVVKVDGDGQMDPRSISRFIAPLIAKEADYTKGNRFYSIYNVRSMPAVRLWGNAILSFMTKLSSGYWSVFDPTNGYTAIHAVALRQLELRNISERYYFESDMLANLGGIRAVVRDVPMEAAYGEEKSNLRIRSVMPEFLAKHARQTVRRILYNYFMRDFNLMSLHLVFGIVLLIFGIGFGAIEWIRSVHSGVAATTGSVMLAVLPIIVGFQLLLSFVGYDISNEPKTPLQHSALLNLRAP